MIRFKSEGLCYETKGLFQSIISMAHWMMTSTLYRNLYQMALQMYHRTITIILCLLYARYYSKQLISLSYLYWGSTGRPVLRCQHAAGPEFPWWQSGTWVCSLSHHVTLQGRSPFQWQRHNKKMSFSWILLLVKQKKSR